MTDVDIRRAGPDDWALVREVRIATLRTDPEQFSSRAEEAEAFSPAQWTDKVRRDVWLVAVAADGRPVGCVRTGTEDGAPAGDRVLASLWVAPGYRGTGLVDRLVEAVRADAEAAGAQRVTLWVKRSNDRARAAYARLGFVPLAVPPAQSGHECSGELRLGLRLRPAADVVVRTLADPDAWAALRDVRLAALRTDPGGFWSTYDAEAVLTEADWRDRAARGVVRLAVDAASGDTLGMLGTTREEGAPPGGTHLWGMWVAPVARGRGVARVLVEAVAQEAAAAGDDRLTLWVREANGEARTAYAALGFAPEDPPDGVADFRGHDEVRLVRHLA